MKNHIPKTSIHNKLTLREIEIVMWTARGKTYGEISTFLSITQDTIKAHIGSVRYKLNATNKTHAVAIAIVQGYIKFEDILPSETPTKVEYLSKSRADT